MSFAITMLPAFTGHRWVCVEGPVDASSAADVRAVVATALAMPARRLTIDLRQAQVDAAGWALVAELMSAATEKGVEVRLLDAGWADRSGRQASVADARPTPRPVPTLVAG
ncbi:STAS domain-containing protein [Micromonospora sp. URMC 106]|uniref:STAS domain-containing protein n=1 Tax=Micromonospora sp. URMC 106 TaxID=3423408 RepID=UPI003F1B426B